MSVATQLLDEINDRNLPNKDRILYVHKLVEELTSGINGKMERERVRKDLIDYYLGLQFAYLSEDKEMMKRYRKEFIYLIETLENSTEERGKVHTITPTPE